MGYSHSSQSFQIGDLRVGGAIRANYILGDYTNPDGDAPYHGGNGGNFKFDTFRVNLDYMNLKASPQVRMIVHSTALRPPRKCEQ